MFLTDDTFGWTWQMNLKQKFEKGIPPYRIMKTNSNLSSNIVFLISTIAYNEGNCLLWKCEHIVVFREPSRMSIFQPIRGLKFTWNTCRSGTTLPVAPEIFLYILLQFWKESGKKLERKKVQIAKKSNFFILNLFESPKKSNFFPLELFS